MFTIKEYHTYFKLSTEIRIWKINLI